MLQVPEGIARFALWPSGATIAAGVGTDCNWEEMNGPGQPERFEGLASCGTDSYVRTECHRLPSSTYRCPRDGAGRARAIWVFFASSQNLLEETKVNNKLKAVKATRKIVARAMALVLAMGVGGWAAAQIPAESQRHLDAATRNVGDDPFMMQYSRQFYCNLPEDNNDIVIAARGFNNTTGTGANAIYRIPLTRIFDDV